MEGELPEWCINMRQRELQRMDEDDVPTKVKVLEQYIGKSLAKLVGEYCHLVKCENDKCANLTTWGVCSFECAMEMSIRPTCSLFH